MMRWLAAGLWKAATGDVHCTESHRINKRINHCHYDDGDDYDDHDAGENDEFATITMTVIPMMFTVESRKFSPQVDTWMSLT